MPDQGPPPLYPPPPPALDAAIRFFNRFFFDEDWGSARQMLAGQAALNPLPVRAGLAGVEALLADPATAPGTLAGLVAFYAGWPLDDPTDAGARAWLAQVVVMVREVLGDAPARQ